MNKIDPSGAIHEAVWEKISAGGYEDWLKDCGLDLLNNSAHVMIDDAFDDGHVTSSLHFHSWCLALMAFSQQLWSEKFVWIALDPSSQFPFYSNFEGSLFLNDLLYVLMMLPLSILSQFCVR